MNIYLSLPNAIELLVTAGTCVVVKRHKTRVEYEAEISSLNWITTLIT